MTALSVDALVEVERTLVALTSAGTEEELEASLAPFCGALGFPYFAYSVFDRAELSEKLARRPMLASNYPEAWRARYRRRKYHELDPVVTSGARSRAPFLWGGADYLRGLPSLARRLFDEAGDFGLRSGFTVVVHGPEECGLFSVASPDDVEAFRGVALAASIPLQIVAAQLHAVAVDRFYKRAAPASTPLTEHERLCLSWTMRGKTAWEISQIVHRSRPTVDFHLQKAMRKLDASNKFHAAFKALQAGLI
jgi:DNA-binding CsgD family transcriptional regulator